MADPMETAEPNKVEQPPGARARTPQQLARQEKAFGLSVEHGKTVRQIAAEMHITTDTVISDLRHEQQRRADEIAERRETEKARAVGFYERAIARAIVKSDLNDKILERMVGGGEGRVSDKSLDSALKARERIDKILGLDAPTRVEVGLQGLLAALDVPE